MVVHAELQRWETQTHWQFHRCSCLMVLPQRRWCDCAAQGAAAAAALLFQRGIDNVAVLAGGAASTPVTSRLCSSPTRCWLQPAASEAAIAQVFAP